MTDDLPKEEHVTSGFAMRMLFEYDKVYREKLLDGLYSLVLKNLSEMKDAVFTLPKPNKYQKRYARVGRKIKRKTSYK